MKNDIPRLRMFAGPNGSGKSTVKSMINPALLGVYINPDEIEKEIRERNYLDLQAYGIKTSSHSHVAVLKWENGERNVSPSLELCIRLYVLNHLHVRDKEFRNLYNHISLEKLSKPVEGNIHPLSIDIAEDLKLAL